MSDTNTFKQLFEQARTTPAYWEQKYMLAKEEIAQLRAERDELKDLTSTDLIIKELHITPGRLDLSATHPLADALTASLVSVFKSAGAENYFEMEAFREDVGPIVITIQRRDGKTPGRISQELRAERDRYKTALESIADAPNWTHKGGWDLLSELLPIAHKALEANNE